MTQDAAGNEMPDDPLRQFFGAGAAGYACVLTLLAILALHLTLVINRPWVLVSTASYDDNLYVALAGFLREGLWLGPYTEFTLAKPPGFSLFLWASSLSGLPLNLSVGAFQIFSAGVFGYGILRLLRSRATAILCFGLLLLSPQFFLLGRVVRETIYPFQTILFFGLLLIFWQARRQALVAAALAGLTLGWIWITREDGIWLVPGLVVAFALPVRTVPSRAAGAAVLVAVATLPSLAVGAVNHAVYGRWVVSELKDPTFVDAISATQSVADGGRIDGVAVTRSAREAIYEVSPTFSLLRPILEAPNYFAVSCTQGSGVCGEIGNGWWHWAVRSAAWQLGYHPSAPATALFYDNLGRDLDAACKRGTLDCDRRPVAALPTLTAGDFAEMPGYVWSILRVGLLLDLPRPLAGYSVGDPVSIEQMLAVLNRPPAFRSAEYAPRFLSEPAAPFELTIFKILQPTIEAYRIAYAVMLALAASSLVMLAVKRRRMRFDNLAALILMLVVFAGSRVGLLAIVGVSSFPTNTPLYMGPVFHIMAVLPLLIIAYTRSRLTDRTR